MPIKYPFNTEIIQQTFMGLSIVDFNVSLGFNSNASNLSVNLVADDANYESLLRWGTPDKATGNIPNVRDAVTEGYHPWDRNAFPKGLLAKYNGRPPYEAHAAAPPHPKGDLPWFPSPGSPVYFNYYNGKNLTNACVNTGYGTTCDTAFTFNGILSNYSRDWGSSGETYSLTVTDPREVLENTMVILDGYAGRTSPADAHYIAGSQRTLGYGWNGYYNLVNVFGYYESHGFNKSQRTEKGMQWFNPTKVFTNDFGGSHAFGILPALDFMLSGDAIRNPVYVQNAQEPFGGPLYYNVDERNLLNGNAPYSLAKNLSTNLPYNINRYAVDLSDLYNLNSYYNQNQPTPGILPSDFEIDGSEITLLQLIQKICEAAACDFFVWMHAFRHPNLPVGRSGSPIMNGVNLWDSHKDYAGVIKVTPIPRNLNIRTGVLADAFDKAVKVPPEPPWIDAEKNPTMVSANLGYEFTDPVSGQMILGAPRTRVVGVTPLGNPKRRDEIWWNKNTGLYLDERGGSPKQGDDILHEYMPSIETDGVTLYNQTFPIDDHRDSMEAGWNPYGFVGRRNKDNKPNFLQNLPMVNNSNYLKQHFYLDFKQSDKTIDPFQFNRAGTATLKTGWETNRSTGYLDIYPCWGFTEEVYTPQGGKELENGQLGPNSPLNDIIDLKAKGRPIRGLYWDDDPYRDFHPTEGIFGSLEFYNPRQGTCHVDGADQVDAQGNPVVNGAEITALKNKPETCECDPTIAGPSSECVLNGGVPYKTVYRNSCQNWSECQDDSGAKVEDIHGKGSNFDRNKWTCENACFVADNQGNPTNEIVIGYKQGTKAIDAAKAAGGFTAPVGTIYITTTQFANMKEEEKKEIIFIYSDGGCNEAESYAQTQISNVVAGSNPADFAGTAKHAIKGTGQKATNNDGNKSIGGGGLYSKECLATSFRNPQFNGCFVKVGQEITDEDGNVKFKENDHVARFKTSDDCLYADCCETAYLDKVEWRTAAETMPAFTDPVYKMTINNTPAPGFINARAKVYGRCVTRGAQNLMPNITDNRGNCQDPKSFEVTNLDANTKEGLPVIPKTATIPIDLSMIGYQGGPNTDRNMPNKGAKKYYYATVTELRFAATSKDSWIRYITSVSPYLACWMYANEKGLTSAWKDLCPVVVNPKFVGGASETEIDAAETIASMGPGGGEKPVTPAMRNQSGNPKSAASAQGHPCGDDPKRSELSFFEKTTMQVDIAYKKIQEVATKYYGLQYLVPLPFNPPTSHTCSNVLIGDKTTCIDQGYDWGAHGMVSEWFQRMGIGICVKNGKQTLAADKFACEITDKGFWVEPAQEINKWEITSAGWPGGDTNFKQDDNYNTGYPQNANFFDDKGNVKAFAVFPSFTRKLLAGTEAKLDFSNLGPETTHFSPHKTFGAGVIMENFSSRVYTTINVDPKTHWLPSRPDWEVQNEKQYAMHLCGDGDANPEYATIGPEDNLQELNERDVFVRDDKNVYHAALRPFALITLPAAVEYGDMDRSVDGVLGNPDSEICIPLRAAKNGQAIMSGFTRAQNPAQIAAQQIVAMANNAKSAPTLSPDMGRSSFIAARHKPYHAAIPQQSKHYRWGPWGLGLGFGKPELVKDESFHPGAFGSEELMGNVAMSRIKTKLVEAQRYIETGSVTLAGVPAYAFATQMVIDFGGGVIEYGPYITDMSVGVGSGGVTTTYNFSTQRKFGQLGKIYEERIRKSQDEANKNFKRLEDTIQRVKRGIDSYKKK